MQKLIGLLLATLPAFATVVTEPAGIGGFGTTTIGAGAEVFYENPSPSDPGSLSTSAEATGLTLGPVRDGFIEITGGGGGEFGSGGGSVGPYSFGCGSASCSGLLFGEPLPFTLGVPFTIEVGAFASSFEEGSGDIGFQFSVFESVVPAPGFPAILQSVIVYDPSSVPEPATFALMGLGFVVGLAKLHVARRARRLKQPAHRVPASRDR